MNRNRLFAAIAALAVTMLGLTSAVRAAGIQDDFQSYATGTYSSHALSGASSAQYYTDAGPGAWTLKTTVATIGAASTSIVDVSGDHRLNMSVDTGSPSPTGTRVSASRSDGSIAGGSFTLSTDFHVNSDAVTPTNGSYVDLSIVALSDDQDFYSTTNAYRLNYRVDGYGSSVSSTVNHLTLSGSGLSLSSADALSLVLDQKYTLSLTGTYTGGVLGLWGELTDGTDTITVSGSDTSPEAGAHFGLFGRALKITGDGAHTTLNVDFDNLDLVPEPTSLALLGLSAAVASLRRRRRA